MKHIKALVIPHNITEPTYQIDLPADEDALDAKLSEIIFGHPNQPVGTGRWTATRTELAFSEIAGDRDDRDEIINTRAAELWNHLQGETHPADDQPLYGTFVAYGFDVNTPNFADVRAAIANFRFSA